MGGSDRMAGSTRRGVLAGAATLAGGSFGGMPAWGQGLSNRAVTVTVPFSAGTAPDVLTRRMAEAYQSRWKQPFVVENRSGASGTVGAATVARAAPDGHSLLITPSTLAMAPSLYRNLPFDPIRSFDPVALLATIGFGLLLHRSAGDDPASFVANAKANPGALNYASPGLGTPHHLSMELFRQKADINVTHVPASSFTSALTDLLSGRVAAMFTTITIAKSLPTDGSVKLVAVASPTRLPTVPDVPTLAELGFPDVHVSDWFAMFAPAGTPQPIVGQLNATANEILVAPEIQSWLPTQGLVGAGGTPDQLRALLASEVPRWATIVRSAGIRLD